MRDSNSKIIEEAAHTMQLADVIFKDDVLCTLHCIIFALNTYVHQSNVYTLEIACFAQVSGACVHSATRAHLRPELLHQDVKVPYHEIGETVPISCKFA